MPVERRRRILVKRPMVQEAWCILTCPSLTFPKSWLEWIRNNFQWMELISKADITSQTRTLWKAMSMELAKLWIKWKHVVDAQDSPTIPSLWHSNRDKDIITYGSLRWPQLMDTVHTIKLAKSIPRSHYLKKKARKRSIWFDALMTHRETLSKLA